MRDAALNLALRHPFAGQLANPRQMMPYTFADSPVVRADDAAFSGGPVAGAMLPDARVGDRHLSDLLGTSFSVIVFDASLAQAVSIPDVEVILLDADSGAAKMLSAHASSAYLVRPDLHIAGRWFNATPGAITRGQKHAIAGGTV
jgi:3-(3-hydroxy-phenyl)propionate hydroxylase